eukprot:Skav204569  [mRNA]  locus=scaffold2218:133994:134350:- [translate_table: standard]
MLESGEAPAAAIQRPLPCKLVQGMARFISISIIRFSMSLELPVTMLGSDQWEHPSTHQGLSSDGVVTKHQRRFRSKEKFVFPLALVPVYVGFASVSWHRPGVVSSCQLVEPGAHVWGS